MSPFLFEFPSLHPILSGLRRAGKGLRVSLSLERRTFPLGNGPFPRSFE